MAGRISMMLGPAMLGCSMDGSGTPDGPPPPPPEVRIAHFTAGAPAFDVCIQGSAGTGFTGPIVHSMLQRVGGVPYGNASAYMTLPADTYTVRVVGGSAANCNIPLAGLPDIPVSPIVNGHRYTVAAMGYLFQAQTLKFVVFEDDLTTAAGQARLRFLHAASMQGGLELGTGSGGSFMNLLTAGSYGGAADAGGGAEYLTVAPQSQATWSLRDSGSGTDLDVFTSMATLTAGEVYTATATGLQGNASTPLTISLCDDTAMPQAGLSSCTSL